MSKREFKKVIPRRRETKTPEEPPTRKSHVRQDLDDVLDEIDEILEENAEEFVKAYQQKGGE